MIRNDSNTNIKPKQSYTTSWLSLINNQWPHTHRERELKQLENESFTVYHNQSINTCMLLTFTPSSLHYQSELNHNKQQSMNMNSHSKTKQQHFCFYSQFSWVEIKTNNQTFSKQTTQTHSLRQRHVPLTDAEAHCCTSHHLETDMFLLFELIWICIFHLLLKYSCPRATDQQGLNRPRCVESFSPSFVKSTNNFSELTSMFPAAAILGAVTWPLTSR